MKFYLSVLIMVFVINHSFSKEAVLAKKNNKQESYSSITTPYSYSPEDAVGKFEMRVDGWRNLIIKWNGIPLLAEGGQLYSRAYQRKLKYTKLHTGLHPYNEDDKARNIPVHVTRKPGVVEYTWSCWDYRNGVRQTNRARMEKDRVVLDVSIEFSRAIPNHFYFHPILFPGEKNNYKKGVVEDKIEGKNFTITDIKGTTSQLTYSRHAQKLWVKNNCRTLSVDLPEGNIKYSFSSNSNKYSVNFYTGETWTHELWTAERKAIIGDVRLKPEGKNKKITWRTVIEAGAVQQKKLTALPAKFPEHIQCNVEFEREFAYFYPGEMVNAKLTLDNRWSTKKKAVSVLYEIRDYTNNIIKQKKIPKHLLVKQVTEVDLELGKLPRGTYSVSVLVEDQKKKALGYVCFRVGVVPQLKPYPSEKSFFGSFQAYRDNIDTKIELAKYTGVRSVRFRSGVGEEEWAKFEPEKGKYKQELIGPAIAKKYASNNISQWFHGEQYPPTLHKKLPAGLTEADITRAYYHSRQKKDGYLPKDGTVFVDYIKKYISGFPMIKLYEVMNEPHTTMDIDFATRTIKLVNQAVKAIYPDAKIMGVGVNKLTPEVIEWIENLMAKAHPYIDIISYHQYQSRNWFKSDSQSYFAPIETLGWEQEIAEIAKVAKKYGKEFCNSELSWVGSVNELFPEKEFSNQERNSVNMFLRSYMLTKAGGATSVTLCFGTSLRGTGCDYILSVEKAASLVGLRKMVKPWSVAHATLVELMDGATFIEKIDMKSKEVYNLSFEGLDAMLWSAIWNYKTQGLIKHLFKPDEVILRNSTGGLIPFKSQLLISGAPLFIINKTLSKKDFAAKLASIKYIPIQSAKIENISIKDGNNKIFIVTLKNMSDTTVKIKRLGFISGSKRKTTGLFNFMLLPGIHSFELPIALASTVKMRVNMELKGESNAGRFYDSYTQWYAYPIPQTAARFGALPVYQAPQAPVIDGNPTDKVWNDAPLIVLNTLDKVLLDPDVKNATWSGADDLSVKARLLWDKQYIYFLAEVKDDIHLNNQKAKNIAAWAGDAIQIALDLDNDSKKGYDEDDHEINIALWNGKPIAWHRTFGNEEVSTGPFKDAKIAITRDETTKITTYELAIPLSSLAPMKPGSLRSKCIKFNFIVNDDDGVNPRRTKWIGITKGIGETKNPDLYKNMLFIGVK